MSSEEKEYEIEDVEQNFDNKDFMKKAIEENASWAIAYASDRLHADRELMLNAIKKDGQMLYYASKDLRDDKELVKTAIRNKWLILKYASKRLRSDKEIAIVALKQNKKTWDFLTDDIKSDSDIQQLFASL